MLKTIMIFCIFYKILTVEYFDKSWLGKLMGWIAKFCMQTVARETSIDGLPSKNQVLCELL